MARTRTFAGMRCDPLLRSMPFDAKTIGPQKEWTGVGYNDYNKGDAYTKEAIEGTFMLTFDVELDQRQVAIDSNKSEKHGDGDAKKLSFVANSGVKIGALDQQDKYEIAIIDVVKWVELAGRIDSLENASKWGGQDKDVVKVLAENTPGLSKSFSPEGLNTLMTGVKYRGDYSKMTHADDIVLDPVSWEASKDILDVHLTRMAELGNKFTMKIEFTPSQGTTQSLSQY